MSAVIAAQAEFRAYRKLVEALQAAGAITDRDCATSRTVPPTTPGLRIFAALHEWEAALIELHRQGARP
ncbi:MAG TPA: hypothetical protein VKA83_25860 [Methylomirabilota bacterium]|nr:hypothetical protein [Methylomirabilota bacterium]